MTQVIWAISSHSRLRSLRDIHLPSPCPNLLLITELREGLPLGVDGPPEENVHNLEQELPPDLGLLIPDEFELPSHVEDRSASSAGPSSHPVEPGVLEGPILPRPLSNVEDTRAGGLLELLQQVSEPRRPAGLRSSVEPHEEPQSQSVDLEFLVSRLAVSRRLTRPFTQAHGGQQSQVQSGMQSPGVVENPPEAQRGKIPKRGVSYTGSMQPPEK